MLNKRPNACTEFYIELHPRSSGHVRFRPPSQPPPVAVVPLPLSVTLLEMRSETLVEEAASARAEVIATDAALAAAVTLLLSVYPPTSLN